MDDGRRLLAELTERRKLLEELARITSSISHRQPLQEVLDSITQGAAELLGDEIVGLRLRDPSDPEYVLVVSHVGLDDPTIEAVQRTKATDGVGGRAMLEDRLIVLEDYAGSSEGLDIFKERQLQAAMSAPVREGDRAIGSLTVATYREGRSFSASEADALMALAEHASVALTDAKNIEEMREAQRKKDMFLAMVSHELKTPLTAIMGTLGMLERHDGRLDPDARKEMLRSAIARGLDLQRMIDQLLQGASAEMSDSSDVATVADMVKEAASGFENTFRLRIRPLPDATCRVRTRTVKRVLGILLENSMTHSEPGTPIGLDAAVEGHDVIFTVENFGDLPPDRSTIFDPFQSGDDAGGVGLGLYIAANLTRSIGGELTADASDGLVRFKMIVPGVIVSDLDLVTEEDSATTGQ